MYVWAPVMLDCITLPSRPFEALSDGIGVQQDRCKGLVEIR